MVSTIGLFEGEHQVLEAASRLREGGAARELRVIVKNEEGAPLLASQDDLPVEGVAGVREPYERAEREDGGQNGDGGVFIPAAAYLGSMQSSGVANNLVPFASIGLADLGDDRLHATEALRRIGVPDGATELCAKALQEGKFALLCEADESDRRTAAADMRSAGALDVWQD